MANMYLSENGKGFIIYPLKNKIFLQYKSAERFGRVSVAAGDYSGCLTHQLYNGMLYYAYETPEKTVVFSSSGKSGAPLPHAGGIAEAYSPKLLLLPGTLVLFYIIKDRSRNCYRLCCCQPLLDVSQSEPVSDDFFERFSYDAIARKSQPDVLILLSSANGDTVLRFTPSLPAVRLIAEPDVKNLTNEKERQIAALEAENSELKEKLSRAVRQYRDLMEVAEQYKMEAAKWYQRFLRRK